VSAPAALTSKAAAAAAAVAIAARLAAGALSLAAAPLAAVRASTTAAPAGAAAGGLQPHMLSALRAVADTSFGSVAAVQRSHGGTAPRGECAGMAHAYTGGSGRSAGGPAGWLLYEGGVGIDAGGGGGAAGGGSSSAAPPPPLTAAAAAAAAAAPTLTTAVGAAAALPFAGRKRYRKKEEAEKSDAGGKWFHVAAQEMTPELKKDLLILRNRDYVDPKHHYKGSHELAARPRYFDVGTVQEAPHEFFTSRLTRKERKPTLVAALMADERFKAYAKKQVAEVSTKAASGGKVADARRRAASKPWLAAGGAGGDASLPLVPRGPAVFGNKRFKRS